MAEKKHLIATEPANQIKFRAEPQEEQTAILKLTNRSDQRQAFKVKCTRNELFRIRPATGILDFNQTLNVTLIYKGGKEKSPNIHHQFGVYHIPAPENCTCEGAWAEHYGPPQGAHKLEVVWNE